MEGPLPKTPAPPPETLAPHLAMHAEEQVVAQGDEPDSEGWPTDLPAEYLPDAVYDAVDRSERLCFEGTTTMLEVDCEAFPCLVASLSDDGVVMPFCTEAEAPVFPFEWMETGSPISLRNSRFTKVQPMLPERYLADPELWAQTRQRELDMTREWVKGHD